MDAIDLTAEDGYEAGQTPSPEPLMMVAAPPPPAAAAAAALVALVAHAPLPPHQPPQVAPPEQPMVVQEPASPPVVPPPAAVPVPVVSLPVVAPPPATIPLPAPSPAPPLPPFESFQPIPTFPVDLVCGTVRAVFCENAYTHLSSTPLTISPCLAVL